jgi:hypothetical protein
MDNVYFSEAALALARAVIDETPAAVAFGRKGGRARSEAKTEAARANGKKGGRPRKVMPPPL